MLKRHLVRGSDGLVHYQRSIDPPWMILFTLCNQGLLDPRRVPPEVTVPTCLECLAWAR